jgi:hypothetical protein
MEPITFRIRDTNVLAIPTNHGTESVPILCELAAMDLRRCFSVTSDFGGDLFVVQT